MVQSLLFACEYQKVSEVAICSLNSIKAREIEISKAAFKKEGHKKPRGINKPVSWTSQ